MVDPSAVGPETFLPPTPRLRLEPILRFQRYRDLSRIARPILEAAEAMIAVGEKLADPQVVFLTRGVERVGPETLRLVDGPTFHGRCFGTHVASAREVACFILTIGPALDERVAEMADGSELLEALFLDTAGWLAIEDAVRAFRSHLRGRVRTQGLRLGPRLGPGYLDWPLGEQTPLFGLFSGPPLPVTLSEYCVMTPRKSISGLFGFLPHS